MFFPNAAAHMLAMESFAFDKMKSSRRKQSKPIRVSYSAEGEATDPKNGLPGQPKDPKEEEFAQNNGSIVGDNEHFSDQEAELLRPLPSSEHTLPSSDDIERYRLEEKLRMTTPPDLDTIRDSFPTKYHQLGRELFDGNHFSPDGNDKSPGDVDQKNSMDEEELDQLAKEEGRKLDGRVRIFHQDAYCEICDREFCNKYFLKTHKANKHGIFDNELSPSSMVSMPSSMPTHLPPSMSPMSSIPLERDSPAHAPPTPTAPGMSTPSSFKIMDFIQNLPASDSKGPKMSDSVNTPKADSDTPSSSATKSMKDMEDFCELCQKHFCNKYYLKKHKQDVHGIAPPDGSSTHKRGRPKDLQAQLDAITSSAVASATANVPPLIPHSMANMAGLPNMPGVMVLNPFMAGMAPMLIPTGSLMPGGQLPPPPGLNQPSLSLPSASPEMPSPAITSTASPSSHTGESRGMGVLDAEAYCDLCKKEFCNKYFLKIHKANKHGMYLDEFPFGIPPLPNNPFKINMSEPGIISTSSPLSSIAMEHERELSKMKTSSPKTMPSLVASSTSSDNLPSFCNLCNQEFSSRYSYKIHRIQVHGLLNEGIGLENILNEELLKNSMRENALRENAFRENAMRENAHREKAQRENAMRENVHRENAIRENVHRENVMRENAFRPKEDPFKISPGSASKSSEDTHSTEDTKVPENGRTTMFGNMVAAKLADRVTCDICNKELCNKYFLRVHKFKVHGIEFVEKPELTFKGSSVKMQLTGDFELIKKGMSMKSMQDMQFKMEPKEMPLHSPQLPSSLPLPALPKPSDSQTPELFRKTPELSTNTSTTTTTTTEKPSSNELVKMGIDPEAYCEICKKEFCSKYFLRTHKQNIHGIRSEATPEKLDKFSMMMYSNSIVMNNNGMPANGMPTFPGMLPMNSMNGNNSMNNRMLDNTVANVMNSVMNSMNKRDGSNSFLNNNNNSMSSMNGDRSSNNNNNKPLNLSMGGDKPLNLGGMNGDKSLNLSMSGDKSLNFSMSGDKSLNFSMNGEKSLNLSMSGEKLSKSGYENHSWRWKEPVNSSRVTCEICNKEVCNKYFLRTHKLKKHGIIPSESSMSPGGMNMSPATSDMETSSNSSLPTDLSTGDKNYPSPYSMKQGNITPSFEDKLKALKAFEPPNFSQLCPEEEMMANRFFNYGEICYLCDRRFKSTKWLKAHIIKDHAGMIPNLPSEVKKSLNLEPEFNQKMCRLCDNAFPSELAMHLHMIQDHNAQVSLNTSDEQPKKRFFGPKFALKKRFSFVTKQKLYTCSVCEYKSKWLNNVYSHEVKTHNLVQRKSQTSRLVNGDHDILRTNKAGVKSYRCNTCDRAFSTAMMCHHHIRVEHIRKRNFKLNNKLPKSRVSCELCPFSTLFPKQLQHHIVRNHSNSKVSPHEHSLNMDDETSGNNTSQLDNHHVQSVFEDNNDIQKQSFQIADCNDLESDFPTSVVKIPVRRHYSAPVTVTFVLTPMER